MSPDFLSEADQALIAQAVAAGRVTICPPVVFKPVPSKFNIPPNYPKPVPGTAAARRERVRELANGRRSVPEIAATLGVDPNRVKADVWALRSAGVDVRTPGRGVVKGSPLKFWGKR